MRLTLAFAAALSLTAAAAHAQPAGEYALDLSRMITETAGGTCPADLMGAQLLSACQAQIAGMQAGLSSLGAVESVTFVQADDMPQGKVETYRVRFAGGQEMNWSIGMKGTDGKYETAFTRGD